MKRNGIDDIWGARAPHLADDSWPERVDENIESEPERWTQSCCVLCSNGCGLDIGVRAGRIVGVRGRSSDRINRGRLGPKGLNAWQANNSQDRLLTPYIRKSGVLVPSSWDEAMSLIALQCSDIQNEFGRDAVGIYNSGQLFLEDYYALVMIAKAGLRTNNLDANTRMCTATAAQALKESFGADGQPGCYSDIDCTECILLFGHNPAYTQTVLWSRILDRLCSEKRPRLIVIDPRTTESAKRADIHLAPRLGTNVAVLNGLIRLIIKEKMIDEAFVQRNTVGFEALVEITEKYTPEYVQTLTGVTAHALEAAAITVGTVSSFVSTVLQGFYQSNQATAAACQVNNLHLLRGMIGRPGAGILQMNGQPTAQNTRETGCDGDYPGFLNFQNEKHIELLTQFWNIETQQLPHQKPQTDAMEMFRQIEAGSIRWLWVIGTNPAVSLPELQRVRRVLANENLFLVAQDAFMTETALLADVVLPAAMWGEKLGTFTNTDRTVHISSKAVEPPGTAKSDFDIFLDFAKRMHFQDRNGAPLIKFSDPEGAFNQWCQFSNGLLPDYSAMTYEKLRGGAGIQWPCNLQHPNGSERLYTDHQFPTRLERCQTYGHDLSTGKPITKMEFMLDELNGRARLRPSDYVPAAEQPDSNYPFFLTTGRVAHQFHTRTKTGRTPKLNAMAPHMVIQLAAADAKLLDIQDGDQVVVESKRGFVKGPVEIIEIVPGHIFIPFHYGYWDDSSGKFTSAANELTMTHWDPVSKQPTFKFAAVRISKTMY